jgi:hypothetical protein
MLSGSVSVTAKEGSVENAKPERIDSYSTTQDILFSIIRPRLNKIVNEQYGREMFANPMKVNEVYIMNKLKSTKGKDTYEGWYQLDMFIWVGEKKPDENFKMDRIVLKIDIPNVGEAYQPYKSDEINDITVDLVEYYKGE